MLHINSRRIVRDMDVKNLMCRRAEQSVSAIHSAERYLGLLKGKKIKNWTVVEALAVAVLSNDRSYTN